MTQTRPPLDAALDVFLFAPVGLALTLGEELPKLAAKGRTELTVRTGTARMVGQLAVAQARRTLHRQLHGDTPSPSAGEAPTGPEWPVTPLTPPHPALRPLGATDTTDTTDPTNEVAPLSVLVDGPAVDSLAIPGYDSLSASQVVQRLAGLSEPELQAVKDYEATSRGRRTILARVGQLQAS